MTDHTVAFHIDNTRVVCSCGADFGRPMQGAFMAGDAIEFWAAHLRQTVEHNLTDAYEAGWRDACDDHLKQREDSSWPIGFGKRIAYPAPGRNGDEHAEATA